MTCKNCSIEDFAAMSESCPGPAVMVCCGLEQQCCSLRLFSPSDPLTRLLMKADGVTESYLDTLLRRVAEALWLRRNGASVTQDSRVSVTAP